MKKKISIMGIPLDLGQTRRGVDMGPSAIRYAGIVNRLEKLAYEVEDLNDFELDFSDLQQAKQTDNSLKLKNFSEVVKANQEVASVVSQIIARDRFPLILGGDHSISIGTLAGIAKHYRQLGIIWFDAHGDLNTPETTPTGNIHGMPLAVNLGFGHSKLINIGGYSPKATYENVVLIGVRALDEGEKQFIREKQIKVFTMHEIDRLGMARVMEEAIEYLEKRTDGVHVSFDLDCLDPSDAPGVGTAVLGGITYREGNLAMEILSETKMVTSAEFVEVNPILDEKNKTATVAVELIGSLFGETLK